MSAIVIIPSRYSSTRFPGKPLCLLSGKPMIQHVYERVRSAKLVLDVFVATDSEEIANVVRTFGGKALMTSDMHESGTDRIAEAALKMQASGYRLQDNDVIVNVQGDEPLIRPEMVDEVVELMEDNRAAIGTLAKRIEDPAEINDPNIVKVAFDADGFALYFSRAPIPYHRDLFGAEGKDACNITNSLFMFKHIGIYAYRKKTLHDFSGMRPSRLEKIERLEQLRAMENRLAIKVKQTMYESIGVDTPMDMERVEKCLSISL